ncbi:MAG: rod shape-determining protein MreC [Candidatus Moranbacteria bacterium]|nr:rod shape-determining protein MreC [Candidatus Moranbacteria bacterium]
MNKNKKINSWLVIGLLIILVISFFGFKKDKPLQSVFNIISKPFTRFFSGAGYWFNKKVYFVSNIGDLKNQNEELFNENLELKFKLAQRKDIESENKVLREEINLISRTDFETEASLILGHTLSRNRKVVYLDKGRENGVEVGMPVVVGEGVLVGKVSKVYEGSSEAELLLDKNNKINAEIQETQVKGIVQGEYGTSAIMDMIPQAADIQQGQTVITSGLGRAFPRGLLIGYVKEVDVTADQLFQKVSLELPVQFNNLRMVWVIKESSSEVLFFEKL